MSLAYFPMFPTDFDADTGHLTLAEDGAYNRLLRLSWKCPEAKLPDDLDWICRKARATTQEDRALIEAMIVEFFTRRGGKVFSQRLHKEWVQANEAHTKRVSAGKNGGRAKALKNNENNSSNAFPDESNSEAMLKQCSSNQNQNQNHIEKEEANASSKKSAERGSRLPSDWTLPDEYRAEAKEMGASDYLISREADFFRDYWVAKAGKDGVKLDWLATWRNWIRRKLDDPRNKPVDAEEARRREARENAERFRAAAERGAQNYDSSRPR